MQRRGRILLAHDSGARSQAPTHTGFQVEPIHGELLENAALRNVSLVRGEIGGMWTSLDRFLSCGFGFAVRRGDALVCWCTAEYVSDGICGVGIETVPEHQRKGLATSAAIAFVAECRARGMTAHWDCWQDNYPFLRVAEKAGFLPICEYYVYCSDTLQPRRTV